MSVTSGEAVPECEINQGWALLSACCVKPGVWWVSEAVLGSSRAAEATEPLGQKDGTLSGLDERNGRQKVWKRERYWELRTQLCGIVFFLTQA